jgi:hypothetical protein
MLDRPQLLAMLAGAAGGAMAIGSMEAFSIGRAFPLFAIPFATSIVTVLGSPKAGPAQPRALVGGHLVSTLVGLLVVKLCGPAPWAAAVAVGLAMVAMHLTGTFHPRQPALAVARHARLPLSDLASTVMLVPGRHRGQPPVAHSGVASASLGAITSAFARRPADRCQGRDPGSAAMVRTPFGLPDGAMSPWRRLTNCTRR